jgi:hypothetical protein
MGTTTETAKLSAFGIVGAFNTVTKCKETPSSRQNTHSPMGGQLLTGGLSEDSIRREYLGRASTLYSTVF